MKEIIIREGSISEAVEISLQIPEFHNPHNDQIYEARLKGVPHLVLVAEVGGQLAGFKVGYEREKDGSFYSWMGGVLPAFRRHKLARKLAEQQESWAKARNYQCIRFKTRNRLKSMQIFALSRGFYLIGFLPYEDPQESRLIFQKNL